MALDPRLLAILACPKDKGPLLYFADEDTLYNPRLRMRYRIVEDIPVMLIDEAEVVDDAEAERLTAKAAADGIEENWSETSPGAGSPGGGSPGGGSPGSGSPGGGSPGAGPAGGGSPGGAGSPGADSPG